MARLSRFTSSDSGDRSVMALLGKSPLSSIKMRRLVRSFKGVKSEISGLAIFSFSRLASPLRGVKSVAPVFIISRLSRLVREDKGDKSVMS